MTPAELQETLRHFFGTEEYHRYSMLFRNVLLTDGAKFLADEAGAHWLMDAIASHLPSVPKDEHFVVVQFWVQDTAGSLSLQDDVPPTHVYAQQVIAFTDFPLPEIKLYVTRTEDHWLIMLPSEY